MDKLIKAVAAFVLMALPVTYAADSKTVINPPQEGSVSEEQGLEAWSRVYEVASHPRCSNCHTGPSDRPMWSGKAYGKTRHMV